MRKELEPPERNIEPMNTEMEMLADIDDVTIRKRHPFYAMSFRNFRLFFYGQIVSVAGTWMQQVAQSWLIWQITGSARWLGIISGASAIPYVLFSFWGGKIADRYSRRMTLIWTQSLAMVLAFALAALATNRWVPVQAWHVLVLAALSSIVNAFNMPAQQAFVTDMVDDREALGNAIALNSLRFNIARVLGPLLAGVVLVKLSVASCFALNGLSYIAVIISLIMMRLPPFVTQNSEVSPWEGFRYVAHDRPTLRLILVVGGASIFAWSASTLYPLYAADFHKGEAGYSAMMVANGIGAALAGLVIVGFANRISRRLMIYGGAFLFAGALLLFAISHHYALSLTLLVLSGFAMIIFGISANTKVQEDVPDNLRGRVMALYSLVINGLVPVGGLQIGFLAERINGRNALLLNSTLFAIVSAIVLTWSLADRRARR